MEIIPTDALISSDDVAFSKFIASAKRNSLSVYIHTTEGTTEVRGGNIGAQSITTLSIAEDFETFIAECILRLDQELNLDLWITKDRANADVEIFLDREINLGDGKLTLGIALSNLDETASKKRWWEVILNGGSLLNSPTLLRYALIHELAHVLGLEHPFDDADGDVYLSNDPDRSATPEQTVMSYRRPAGGNDAWPIWYSDNDISALQSIWGPSKDTGGAADLEAPALIKSSWNGTELVLFFNESLSSRSLDPTRLKLKLAGETLKAVAASVDGPERRVVVTVDNSIGSAGNLQWRYISKKKTEGIRDVANNPWVSKNWRTATISAGNTALIPARLEATTSKPSTSSTSMATIKPGKTQKLGAGLKRRFLATASTGRPLEEGDLIGVIYTGRLTNGVQFDSNVESAAATGDLFTFRLGAGSVIPGFEQGLLNVPLGSTIQLTIPAALAYGSNGAGERIPPNSTLIFDIQVLAMRPQAGGDQINASWSRDYGFNLSTSPIPTAFSSALTTQKLGTDQSETVNGTSANDVILGLSGKDKLSGFSGDDLIIGGSGKNTAIFSGPRADYQITASDRKGTFLTVLDSVSGRDGTDWLTNINTLIFSDGAVKLTSLLKSSSTLIG